MKAFKTLLVSAVIGLGAGVALTMAHAQQQNQTGPGCMGAGMGPGARAGMGSGMGPGMMGTGGMMSGTGPAMMSGGQMRHQMMMGNNTQMNEIRGLMTSEERVAMMDKMAAAKTPEERQALMAANHAEIEKRAKEKGITLPQQHQQRMSGPHCG